MPELAPIAKPKPIAVMLYNKKKEPKKKPIAVLYTKTTNLH